MQSLAVKYRPTEFKDVSSQESIIRILSQQLLNNDIKNCFLFCGASGCGKTTIARIFANKINQGIGKPIEIDAASNNSVENVRNIVKSAQERAIDGKYKVYIIDECHSLSNSAWQAFLKTIEEPPQFTIFIFCTTDPQKIPATIINRVQRFNFTRISYDKIIDRLSYICEQEHFTNYTDTVDFIAKLSDGGMRDAIAYLEKVSSYSTDLNLNNALNALGNYSYDTFFELMNNIIDGNEFNALNIIQKFYDEGNDLKLFVNQFFNFCLDLNKYLIFNDMSMLKIPNTLENQVKNCISLENASQYYSYIVDKMLELKNFIKNDATIKSTIEVMILKMIRMQ